MQRKKLNYNILHLEDMLSKQQNIFVMDVTCVILALCLAGDKKNRSETKNENKTEHIGIMKQLRRCASLVSKSGIANLA